MIFSVLIGGTSEYSIIAAFSAAYRTTSSSAGGAAIHFAYNFETGTWFSRRSSDNPGTDISLGNYVITTTYCGGKPEFKSSKAGILYWVYSSNQTTVNTFGNQQSLTANETWTAPTAINNNMLTIAFKPS